MKQFVGNVSLLVRDYDEAIAWFRSTLGFVLVEDSDLGDGKRWVVVAPPGAAECCVLLAKAKNAREAATVGNQSGGRVFLFLHTDDFERDHRTFKSRGVQFLEEPRHETYGTVAVFEDLCGNRWDLLQLKP
ncbi:MAG TPA: VOC family protein [Opitutaceae bacterium]|nr:VOC family protein [Opitutaceae bacterium]